MLVMKLSACFLSPVNLCGIGGLIPFQSSVWSAITISAGVLGLGGDSSGLRSGISECVSDFGENVSVSLMSANSILNGSRAGTPVSSGRSLAPAYSDQLDPDESGLDPLGARNFPFLAKALVGFGVPSPFLNSSGRCPSPPAIQ